MLVSSVRFRPLALFVFGERREVSLTTKSGEVIVICSEQYIAIRREYLLKKGTVRFEYTSELVVAPQLVPDIIKALQVGLDNYNATKAIEEREASK